VSGVGHAASWACPSKSIPPVCVAVLLVFGPPLGVFGVAHEANCAAIPTVIPKPLPFFFSAFSAARRASHVESSSFCGPAFGVGHEVEPLPEVRRADAASW
jgi:hypothetical protein